MLFWYRGYEHLNLKGLGDKVLRNVKVSDNMYVDTFLEPSRTVSLMQVQKFLDDTKSEAYIPVKPKELIRAEYRLKLKNDIKKAIKQIIKERKMGCINRSKVFTPASFPGSKSMSQSHMNMGSGKMSSAHGTTTKNATKGMVHASGRVGAGKKGFSSGNFRQGPGKIGKHGKTS